MRPGQGANIGSMGRAGPLGTNLAAWTMAGRLSGFNTNVMASPKTMAGRLSNLNVTASPSITDRLGKIDTKANILGSSNRLNITNSSRLNITNHLNKHAAQRPGSKVKRLNQENNGPRFNTFKENLSKNKAKALTKPAKNADGSVETVSRESLDCHMCNVSNFDSINDYILHLEGANHTAMSKAYSSKCTANLELFRAEAKITALRAITKAIENKKDTQTQFCHKCQCTLVGGLAIHEKSAEHLQVLNYLGVRCCGTSHDSRLDLEEHWLSLQHIQSRSKLFAKFKNHGLVLQKEEQNMQKLSALASAEPHFDESTWPAFDPTVPVGLKFVDAGASNKCRVCSEYLEPKAIVILSHCCSSKHYQNMCIFYKVAQKNSMQFIGAKNNIENEDEKMAKIDLILNSRPKKVKEITNKDESPSVQTKIKDITVTDKKETAVTTSLPKVSTSKTLKEETEEDFGTVLETSILSGDPKNESLMEKYDKDDSVEDIKEDVSENNVKEDVTEKDVKEDVIEKDVREDASVKEDASEKDVKEDASEKDVKEDVAEKVQEKGTAEISEIMAENEKDTTNTDEEQVKAEDNANMKQEQVKVEEEKESSVELTASSSSLSSKLAVISEEECDVCENGSEECAKHNAPGGSPKRKNSGDLKVELGTPKKLRTEEAVVSTPTRRSRRRSVSEEPTTVSTPTRTSSRRKSISEEPSVATPTRVSGRRKSITQL